MADEIDREADKYDMNASQYVRQVLREHDTTPFSCEDTVLCVDENSEERRNEGAA
ncbi:CopG family transcriptional regulator [Haloarcula sp. CBA1131]|nr:CopG family transcriptional regulator [Haloarcula sp. CBA1131]MUV50215.1 CopG family transcriptional regulator [Haloarcula sp. CBA1122]